MTGGTRNWAQSLIQQAQGQPVPPYAHTEYVDVQVHFPLTFEKFDETHFDEGEILARFRNDPAGLAEFHQTTRLLNEMSMEERNRPFCYLHRRKTNPTSGSQASSVGAS